MVHDVEYIPIQRAPHAFQQPIPPPHISCLSLMWATDSRDIRSNSAVSIIRNH